MIKISELNKTYNTQPVLRDLSLFIADNDFFIIVGANGAGKTTLLRILASLTQPNSGKVTINGDSLFDNASLRQNIGYLGHSTLFYGDLDARENLRHYARLFNLSNANAAVQQAITAAGLEAHQTKPVRTYSRGMQQRLAIERVLMHNPSLLLLDEPYTGLDQEAAEGLDERLNDLHARGKTLMVVAHRPQRLLKFASHLAWLKSGQIIQQTPIDQLLNFPKLNQYIREVK